MPDPEKISAMLADVRAAVDRHVERMTAASEIAAAYDALIDETEGWRLARDEIDRALRREIDRSMNDQT